MINRLKQYLYSKALQSPIRKWALSLTGWEWWFWQLVVGVIFFTIVEILLNQIGMTISPWKQ